MKRFLVLIGLMLAMASTAFSQKFALVDMEYILKNIPDYEMMNEQLDQVSKKWQSEIEALENEAQSMYKKYQSDLVFLSAAQKKTREEAIVKKEQEASDLKRKYFGPEGELFKKRSDLMKPIQDEVWNAIKEIAKRNNYQMVLDRGTSGIIFASPTIDISDMVLSRMGFSK